MKQKLLRRIDKYLAFIISILGIAGACSLNGCEYGTPAVEYGTSYATFKVTGLVTDIDTRAISGIKVIMGDDTSFTSETGYYEVETNSEPKEHDFLVQFIDDDNNDFLYSSKDTIVSFINPEFTDGEGPWYEGKVTKELNIKLRRTGDDQ